MKNKILIITILLQIVLFNNLYGEDFLEKGNIINATGGVSVLSNDGTEIEAKEATYNKSKSTLKASGKVFIKDKKNKITILADEIIYNKKKEVISSTKKDNQISVNDVRNDVVILADQIIYNKNKNIINFSKLIKQVNVDDKKNKVTIDADEIVYNYRTQIITSIKQNEQVNINDKKNKIVISANKIKYDKTKNIISSKGKILAKIENEFKIMSEELIHNRNLMKFYSSKKTQLEDNVGNITRKKGEFIIQ